MHSRFGQASLARRDGLVEGIPDRGRRERMGHQLARNLVDLRAGEGRLRVPHAALVEQDQLAARTRRNAHVGFIVRRLRDLLPDRRDRLRFGRAALGLHAEVEEPDLRPIGTGPVLQNGQIPARVRCDDRGFDVVGTLRGGDARGERRRRRPYGRARRGLLGSSPRAGRGEGEHQGADGQCARPHLSSPESRERPPRWRRYWRPPAPRGSSAGPRRSRTATAQCRGRGSPTGR